MKNNRRDLILQLIKNKPIETQEELVEELRQLGVEVTQATVSRDIKALRLIKTMEKEGKYKYIVNENDDTGYSNKLVRIFSESIVSIGHSQNIIVIKTITGSAKAATQAIDTMNWPEILGTVAGDNTIFLVIKNSEDVKSVLSKLQNLKRNPFSIA